MKSLVILLVFWSLVGCGVKGNPRPPQTPAEIGRGKPSFRRATQQYAFPEVPEAEESPEEDAKKKSE